MFQIRRQPLLVYSEDVIRQYALRRVAEVFGVSEISLSNEARFGYELTAAPVSDFKMNEFDMIDDDIKAVADRQILKEQSQGVLVIRTVGEYCDHMVRCNSRKPKEVARILRLPVNS
jgi:hypothetical protein